MKTQIDIDMSPLTNRIYVGRTVPESLHWHGEKRDVTEKVVIIAAEHVLQEYHGAMSCIGQDPETGATIRYEIEVKKIVGK